MRCVRIARSVEGFISECEAALAMQGCDDDTWLKEADAAVEKLSWDVTFERMCGLIEDAIHNRAATVTLQADARSKSAVGLQGDG